MASSTYGNAWEERLRALDMLCNEAEKSYTAKKMQLRSKTEAANLLLMTWAFIFGGVIGLYQANILHVSNIQSVIVLLLTMLLSVFLCVISTILSDYEVSAPNVAELWREYKNAVVHDCIDSRYYIQVRERITASFVNARKLTQDSLEKKSIRLTIAAVVLLVSLFLLVFYVLFPDFVLTLSFV